MNCQQESEHCIKPKHKFGMKVQSVEAVVHMRREKSKIHELTKFSSSHAANSPKSVQQWFVLFPHLLHLQQKILPWYCLEGAEGVSVMQNTLVDKVNGSRTSHTN